MTKTLQAQLLKLNTLTPEEVNSISNQFEYSELKKDGFFVKEDNVCTQMGFLLNGGVKSFSTDGNGKENITCFKFENAFFTSYESFTLREKSKKSIQAIEDSEIMTITYHKLNALFLEIPAFLNLAKTFIEQELIEKENYLLAYNNKTAKEKYLHLLSHHPEIVKRVKVKDISSYLGITERSITRSRFAIMQADPF